ncbi:rcc01693 family protein [Rhizobium sp. BK181]|uniref:rcc01693 family protein n=1 Tax=Rhizobium sp. BK181 TaxID=2587072 RepID=UPI001AED807D|nr:rcc01693 family protein [Rhizobium sp. BK181]
MRCCRRQPACRDIQRGERGDCRAPPLAAADIEADRATPFPWARVLHVGLCLLRLPPAIFWTMTPVEFHAVAGGLTPRSAVARADLGALMAQFPDGLTPSKRRNDHGH